jgi:hypothetical protein
LPGEDTHWGEFEYAEIVENNVPLGWNFFQPNDNVSGSVDVVNFLPGPQDRFMFVPGPKCFQKPPAN